MKAKLVGVHHVKMRLADGSTATYFYAWRGGPRIEAAPGSKAFALEYARLTAKENKVKVDDGSISELIEKFKATAEYKMLRASTRRDYERCIGLIRTKFGTLPLQAVEAKGSRRLFLNWRDEMADTPRSADMTIGVMARLLSWAKTEEMILRNPLEKLTKLHSGTRKDIIWSNEQLDNLLKNGKPHLVQVALIALWTMQRQADILTMPTMAYDGTRVSIKQMKTGARVRVVAADDIVPILDEARDKKRQRVLVNSQGENWTSSGFRASWRKELLRLKISGVTFHDLRGTAITFAYANGASVKQIAEISGHSEEEAEAIIRKHYLAGSEVIDAIKKSRA